MRQRALCPRNAVRAMTVAEWVDGPRLSFSCLTRSRRAALFSENSANAWEGAPSTEGTDGVHRCIKRGEFEATQRSALKRPAQGSSAASMRCSS
jgi:hypothetical protein